MMHPETCPLCQGDLGVPETVEVCAECRSNLDQVTGVMQLSSTGEFAAFKGDQVAAILAQGSAEAVEQTGTGPVCSWCSKSDEQVQKMLSRGTANICNECVALCADIMQMELGDDWHP